MTPSWLLGMVYQGNLVHWPAGVWPKGALLQLLMSGWRDEWNIMVMSRVLLLLDLFRVTTVYRIVLACLCLYLLTSFCFNFTADQWACFASVAQLNVHFTLKFTVSCFSRTVCLTTVQQPEFRTSLVLVLWTPSEASGHMFEIHFSYCSSLRSLQHRGIHLLVDGRPHCTSKRSCQLCLGFRCHDGWIYVNLVMAMDGSNNSNTSHEISELIGVFKSAPRSGSKWIQSTIARLWSMVPQPSQRDTTVIGASSATVPIRGLRGFWTWNPGISQRLTSTK